MLHKIVVLLLWISFSYASHNGTRLEKANSTTSDSLLTEYLLFINNIYMPLDSKGVMADVFGGDYSQGRIDSINFMYSGGFMLSGINDKGEIWANGIATASRINDYLSGEAKWDSVENMQIADTTNAGLFIVKKSDPPFDESWIKWGSAVDAGAYFYDGDSDGLYNPVDKNGNQVWDLDEDSPDMLGDETIWCVYNDAAEPATRQWANVQWQGIEIRQTVWAYSTIEELSNVIFIRYSLLNSGLVSNILDSVFFSIWVDADIGNYNDDLAGCDPKNNTSFLYNEGEDEKFGINPPCFMINLLQGASKRTDNTNEYSLNNKGLLLGSDSVWSETNITLTSVMSYMKSILNFGDPHDEFEARNYMKGLLPDGQLIDPCNWRFGTVNNIDCNSIDPVFMYSGDPVTKNGWINNLVWDQRQMLNSGPFKLEKDNSVDIITAYIVGRGVDSLNSITVTREIAEDVTGFYETNFGFVPVGVENTKHNNSIPKSFSLYQNYPNPFNPSTIISYTIPHLSADGVKGEMSNNLPAYGVVKLVVYDVLGREVATLVNEEQKPGIYKVQFDASNLGSGVYFYQLRSGSFVESKKMILLR